jgi:caffeoyl-CoA O-methyltransferase
MELVDPLVERYALDHTTPETPAMAALAREATATLERPEMLSGAVIGRLLELLVAGVKASLVLEIGTYAGYSALAMAAGLPPEGRIITCEISPQHAAFARRHIEASPYAEKIEIRVGPALETIATIEEPIDFAFIDADKAGYPAYYEAVLERLAADGLIAADNTLLTGLVLEPDRDDGDSSRADVQAIKRFGELVARDRRVSATLLTVRDGITLIRRR